MTFYQPSRKKPVLGLVIFLLFIGVAAVLFFSIRSCSNTGFFRSAKSSDANYVYQVYPVITNDGVYFISLEGVFRTSIYEQKGGMTMRSGSTELRLSLHDLNKGTLIKREVIGDYHKKYSSIIGARDSIFWMYNTTDGLHGRSVKELEIIITQEQLIAANPALSEGLAMSQSTLTNLNELYAFDREHNALMLTTLSGKKVWVEGGNFKTVESPVAYLPKNSYDDIIERTIEQALAGETIDVNLITEQILQATAGVNTRFELDHLSDRIVAFDSCTYKLDGGTLRTITKTDCPKPIPRNNTPGSDTKLIEPHLISVYNSEKKVAINPEFLPENMSVITHAKSIGDKTELLISGINNTNLQKQFTIATGITLGNQRSGYKISAVYGNQDTLLLGINNQLFNINTKTGKLIWKKVIAKEDYNAQLLSVGEAVQNGKRYIVVVNNYFTVLSKQGIFVNGRTDYQQLVIDAGSGKTLYQQDINNSQPEKLPYYLGNAQGLNWFYTNELGFHTRSFPKLIPEQNDFALSLKVAEITSPLVKTSGYGRAIDDKYISFDSAKKLCYFTTENGLHYVYDITNKKISEINAPDEALYHNLKMQNRNVNYYYRNAYYSTPDKIELPNGGALTAKNENAIPVLRYEAAQKTSPTASTTTGTQFIEGEFLINGISLNKDIYYTDKNYNPISTNNKESFCYIWHKNKIAVDAHRIISKYNYATQQSAWQFDVTALLGVEGEISRVYNRKSSLVIIFKTHPNLDDNFTCVSINTDTGNMEWVYKF